MPSCNKSECRFGRAIREGGGRMVEKWVEEGGRLMLDDWRRKVSVLISSGGGGFDDARSGLWWYRSNVIFASILIHQNFVATESSIVAVFGLRVNILTGRALNERDQIHQRQFKHSSLCNLILDLNTPDILFCQGHLFWYVLDTVWTDFLHSFSCIWAPVSISLGCLGTLRMREYIYSLICFTHRQHELSFSHRRTPTYYGEALVNWIDPEIILWKHWMMSRLSI